MKNWRQVRKRLSKMLELGEYSLRQDILSAVKATTKIVPEDLAEHGSYNKGSFTVNGLTVVIENPAGSVRMGTDQSGKSWQTILSAHYGYFDGTRSSSDGDPVDVFIGEDLSSPVVFLIDQMDGEVFDEHKVMIFFPDEESALKAYSDSYDPGCSSAGSVRAMSWLELSEWLKPQEFRVENMAKSYEIGDKMFLFGMVLQPDVVDHQGHSISREVIKKAAREHLADYRAVGIRHKQMVSRSDVVLTQSFINDTDSEMAMHGVKIPAGGWAVEHEVLNDQIKDMIRAGNFKGYSVGGDILRRTKY